MRDVYIEQSDGEKRNVGCIDKGRRRFISKRRRSKHLFHKLNAWALDEEIFQELWDDNINQIVIIDVDTDTVYIIDIFSFEKNSVRKHYKPYRPQLFVPLKYWIKFSLIFFGRMELRRGV